MYLWHVCAPPPHPTEMRISYKYIMIEIKTIEKRYNFKKDVHRSTKRVDEPTLVCLHEIFWKNSTFIQDQVESVVIELFTEYHL